MGSHGGSAPNGFPQRQASTLFLRVPVDDWTRVKHGEISEFRTTPKDGARVTHANVPTIVCAYAKPYGAKGEIDAKVMMLVERREEPLFNIADDADALARAGYPDYATFRRIWRARHGGRYSPMAMCYVWRVRPFRQSDFHTEGLALLRHLYGLWLPSLEEHYANL